MTKQNNSRWVRIMISDEQSESVTHYPPANTLCERSVATDVLAEWRAQIAGIPGAVMAKIEVLSAPGGGWLDFGGMRRIDRKTFSVRLNDELLLVVPAKDVVDYIEDIEWRLTQPAEVLGGKRFRTIPSLHLSILLSEEQCLEVLNCLRTIAAEAEAFATIENAQFNHDIADANHPNVVAPRRPVGPMGRA